MARNSMEKGHVRFTTSFAALISLASKFEITKWFLTNTNKQVAKTAFIATGDTASKVIMANVSIPAGETVCISDINVVISAGGTVYGFVDTVVTGTAQAGTTASITLAAGASAVDDYYNGMVIECTNDSPAGVLGQSNVVADYVGSTKVVTLKYSWLVAPTNATTYSVGSLYLTVEGVETT